MNNLRLLANAGIALSLFGLAMNAKDRFWRGVGFVLATLNLALVVAYIVGW